MTKQIKFVQQKAGGTLAEFEADINAALDSLGNAEVLNISMQRNWPTAVALIVYYKKDFQQGSRGDH